MSIYEDVALTDFRYDTDALMYYYNCPCGDLFEISLEELHEGEDVALCPSCSLKVRVIFEEEDLPPLLDAACEPDACESTNVVSTISNNESAAITAKQVLTTR